MSGMLGKQRTSDLAVPYAYISTVESIACGFRAQMFDLEGDDGSVIGSVQTGTGMGTDFITLNWGEHKAVVRGIDLLRAWVATFDPDGAAQMPGGLA
jgi:hypothetical protein